MPCLLGLLSENIISYKTFLETSSVDLFPFVQWNAELSQSQCVLTLEYFTLFF